MVSFSLLDPQNQRNVTKYWFKTEAVIQIGRSPDNHVCIDDDLVSRQHLELQRVNHSGSVAWKIVNRGTNPTFVNNFPLLKGSSSLLEDGALIKIGKSGGVLLKFQLRCTHAGNAQGNKFCIHCREPLSKPQQPTILEGHTETQLETESEYDRLLDDWELRGVRVEEQELVEQLYQNLSNQGDTRRAARAKSLLDRIEQLKRQTSPVINPPAPLPPTPPPRSELEKVELVETKTNVHAGKVVAVAISPDCQTLVSGGSNNQIKIWNLNTGALAHTLSNRCERINIKPDGQTFVITSGQFYWIYNLQTGQNVLSIETGYIGFNISPDGQKIAMVNNEESTDINLLKKNLLYENWFENMVFLQNNNILIFHLDTGEILCQIAGHSRGNITSAAFDPDGKTLVSGDSNGIIKIWGLGTTELPRILTEHSEAINSLAISPDGKNIVSCSADNTINICNLDTGELIHTLTGNAKVIAISPDSQTLVSGGGKEIKIWEMGTGQLLKTLGSYSPEVTSVAISSDGQMLVTGGSDGTIQIWRVR